jgi:hypothetical protein
MPSHAPERIVIRSGALRPSVFHEVAMKPLFALAVSIALLVALWVYVSIGLPSLQLIPWIGFVAWATFFAAGGGRAAIVQSLPPAIAGVLLTALTMFGVANAGGGLSALIVLVAVLAFVLVAMASHKALAYTPAAFLGAAIGGAQEAEPNAPEEPEQHEPQEQPAEPAEPTAEEA